MFNLKNGDIVVAQRAYVAIAQVGDCGVVVDAPESMHCHPGTLVLITASGYIVIDAEEVRQTGRRLEGASFATCNSARLRGTLGKALAAEPPALSGRQLEILERMREHGQGIRHTKMGFEIQGRYLCDARAMNELVRLLQVATSYCDHPSGGRYKVYLAKT